MPSTTCKVSSRNVSIGYPSSDTSARIAGRYGSFTRSFYCRTHFPADHPHRLLLLCLFVFFLTLFQPVTAQKETEKDSTRTEKPVVVRDTVLTERFTIDPLSPSKAAFYSAILPGLGQIYNKRYWKVPIVYGAIGTGLYFYISNKDQYHRYRNAYKRRLAGFTDDEFYNLDGIANADGSPDVSMDALRRAQDYYQRYKDLSLLITIGLYALNIIDANVDAHLKQHNISQDLTLRPLIVPNDFTTGTTFGLSLSFNF